MCKSSIYAEKTEDASVGDDLLISNSVHDSPTFQRKGTPVKTCVVCIKNGSTLTVRGIPTELCERFDLKDVEVATFVDEGDLISDCLRFSNGHTVNLVAFAGRNISVRVESISVKEPVLVAA